MSSSSFSRPFRQILNYLGPSKHTSNSGPLFATKDKLSINLPLLSTSPKILSKQSLAAGTLPSLKFSAIRYFGREFKMSSNRPHFLVKGEDIDSFYHNLMKSKMLRIRTETSPPKYFHVPKVLICAGSELFKELCPAQNDVLVTASQIAGLMSHYQEIQFIDEFEGYIETLVRWLYTGEVLKSNKWEGLWYFGCAIKAPKLMNHVMRKLFNAVASKNLNYVGNNKIEECSLLSDYSQDDLPNHAMSWENKKPLKFFINCLVFDANMQKQEAVKKKLLALLDSMELGMLPMQIMKIIGAMEAATIVLPPWHHSQLQRYLVAEDIFTRDISAALQSPLTDAIILGDSSKPTIDDSTDDEKHEHMLGQPTAVS